MRWNQLSNHSILLDSILKYPNNNMTTLTPSKQSLNNKTYPWRLARDILPTRANLHKKKGINLDLACPLCNREVETSSHLFMHCNFVRLILFASQLGSHIPEAVELNVWIVKWLAYKDMLGTQLFCTLLWKLWFARNQIVFKGVCCN